MIFHEPTGSQERVGDGQISERLFEEMQTSDKSQPAILFSPNRGEVYRFLRESLCESRMIRRQSLARFRKAGCRRKVWRDHEKYAIRSCKCGCQCVRIVDVRNSNLCSAVPPTRCLFGIPNDRANLLALRQKVLGNSASNSSADPCDCVHSISLSFLKMLFVDAGLMQEQRLSGWKLNGYGTGTEIKHAILDTGVTRGRQRIASLHVITVFTGHQSRGVIAHCKPHLSAVRLVQIIRS